MKAKKTIGKWTLAALAAYEFTLLCISLTPAAGKGTSFGEPAMWQNMLLLAAIYLIPLFFYYLHIEAMRYILAAAVILGILPLPFFLLVFGGLFFAAKLQGDLSSSLGALAVIAGTAVCLLLQILWCMNCLGKRKKHSFTGN